MEPVTLTELAERMRNARKAAGLSQEDVAAKTGIPLPSLSAIEAGKRNVDSLELAKFAAEADKDAFIDKLYDRFLPIISPQYNGNIRDPIPPSRVRERVGLVHPSKYADEVEKFTDDKQDVLFYREFSALFNAKPDFLIVFRDKMLWFEAKFWVAFSSLQLQRTGNIALLCSSVLFEKYFNKREPIIVLLGSDKRHKKAQSFDSTRFLSWDKCLDISLRLLPGGESNYTSRSFKQMLAM